MTFKNSDIIIFSSPRWDDEYSSPAICLAKEFSKNNRVFFIDYPYTIKDYLNPGYREKIWKKRKAVLTGQDSIKNIAGFSQNLYVVTPRLTIPINFLKNGFLYNSLSYLNDLILYKSIRKIIKKFKIKQHVFINTFVPNYLRNLPADCRPIIHVYQTIDDISQEKYIARHGVRLEQEAIQQADITLATSRELTNLKQQYSKQVHYFPNAADLDLFKRALSEKLDKPEEIKGIDKKIICYTGNIGSRINYELLREISLAHKDKLLLLIGPVTTNDSQATGLDELPNVKFTGTKNINDLPAYLQHADCTIIPFEYSVLTKSIYPLKINEYLAAGKPVIATAFSEDIQSFEDVAYIAKTNDQFIELINVAIAEDNIEKQSKRIEKASLNTWEARVELFWNIMENFSMHRN